MIQRIRQEHRKSYDTLSSEQKKRVMFVCHKDLATNTSEVLASVASFIGTNLSTRTAVLMEESHCPRIFAEQDLIEKKKVIEEKCSTEMFRVLLDMENEFKDNPETI